MGIGEGDTTRLIADFAKRTSAKLDAIDPLLPNKSDELLRMYAGTLHIHEGTSFSVLPKLSGYVWIPCVFENGVSRPLHPEGVVPFPVDLSGTGCLMVLRALIPPVCPAYYRGFPSHDCAWSDAIKERGYTILLDPSVRCRHYQSVETFV